METRTLATEQENNLTAVTEFFLLGFQVSQGLRHFLFCIFLVIYCGTICGNLLIITLVSTSKNLHTPMYFFISQLSISDILLTIDLVPNMLHILLNNGGTITFLGCFTQFCFFGAMEGSECLLLTVMSYDRYVAICNPLHYASIMTSSSFLIETISTAKLIFCGPNTIDHLFCDMVPLIELACSDTSFIHLEIYLIGIPIILIPTAIIVVSYTYIVLAILRIPSISGQTVTMSKVLSLLYTVLTPLVNPIIYSLRNKDIRKAVHKIVYQRVI
ncbi:hypothetical protein GDO78_020815 [Eleutherodactylus coqui]|uniref:G-protein coupled receptors family 1 profile domain-containing protein n=1 Tax=Eleutherodactylus coqui TaxID=57060 RepID=A0A8J6JT55_ELECQ|nr:hypothetical protein GDO78_020815 [Eleutherodactylus coqui]